MMVFTLLSILVIVGFCTLFIYQNRRNRILVFALLLKIAAGICLGFVYKYHYQGGDTLVYYNESKTIATYVLSDPLEHVGFYFTNVASEITGLTFYEQPRALFFSKILSVIYLLTGGNYWLMAVMLSIINFLCVRRLVDQITKRFPVTKLPAVVAFYFLPTFVFWTSGILKESLAIGALCLLVALALEWSEPHAKFKTGQIILVFLGGMVLWNLKYFYTAVTIPVLVSVVVFERIKSRKYRIIVPLFLLITLVVIFSVSHYNLECKACVYRSS
ncbi:MAG: hypothetical protein U5K79_19835 [Cyclobacteriaceae bacterium]|nr:hypothetical protein [Cyclobacteriaceae bacterium]